MDVNQLFNEVIRKIEESKLNYIIHHKTPFSAQISLKRSFVKYFDAPTPVFEDITSQNIKDEPSGDASELDKVTKDLDAANAKLDNLENILEKERADFKSLQVELGIYREEALKVKREKKEIKNEIDQNKVQLKTLQKDHLLLCEEKLKSDDLLKERTKALDTKHSEFANLHKEKVKVEEQLKTELKEIETLKQIVSENEKKVQTLDTCYICEDKFKSKVELSQHIRGNHVKEQVTQTKRQKLITSEFFKYPCFYCDEEISDLKILQEHQDKCTETGIGDQKDNC